MYQASLVAQMLKNLPAMQETQVWSLGWEDALEKGMVIHSTISIKSRNDIRANLFYPWLSSEGIYMLLVRDRKTSMKLII